MNTWVIPDIHGYSKTLETLLKQIQPSKNDHLIFLGDYIDRGPDSKGVLDLVMALEKDGYNMTTLRGNHESYFVEAYYHAFELGGGLFKKKNLKLKAWFEHGGKEALKSFAVKDIRKVPEQYIKWIEGTQLYLQTEDYIIVHAGMNFTLDNPYEDEHAMLWIKDFEVDSSKIGGRKVIHGHTPVSHEFILETIERKEFGFIDLDNGVYMEGRNGFGNLMAFNLETKQLVVQPSDF
ncbi:MAG TPA: metallophosphoesterase family protein [Bacteroidales bacterium]|nr:metallophosphoesterase family protein [Bacteroidales bacterium]